MSEFTKGEWKIIGKSEMDGIEIGIDNNDGTKCPLANVKWYGEDDVNAEEDMANARLIAAAPDLLAACKPFARLADMIPAPDAPDPKWKKFYTKVNTLSLDFFRAAKAAIAKAKP